MRGLNNKLEHVEGTWVEELPIILWSLRTTPCLVIGEMPFSTVYGVESVLLVDIGMETARVFAYASGR